MRVGERQAAVYFAYGLPNQGNHRSRLAGCTYREIRASCRRLKIRQINGGGRLTAQLEILRVLSDADDFNLIVQANAPANGIFIAKVPARQRLIDYPDLRRAFIVPQAQATSPQNGNLKRVEKVRRHLVDQGATIFARLWRLAWRRNGGVVAAPAEDRILRESS